MTPLHWAVERAHIECIEWLLRCGSDVKVKNKFDKTPSDIACDNGHPGIMEMLEVSWLKIRAGRVRELN